MKLSKITQMRNWLPGILVLTLISCQTTRIKNEKFHNASSTAELGAIGHARGFALDKGFSSRVYPKLENKIRLDLQILPMDKKLGKLYFSKGKSGQEKEKASHKDSTGVRPEVVVVSLLDLGGFIAELNARQNQGNLAFIRNTKNAQVVASIALAMSQEDIKKIRQADAYYLVNKQEKKYSLALFRQGRQQELLELNPRDVLAYQLGYFCWAESSKGQWEIADINKTSHGCMGNTYRNIKNNKEQNLFKM